MHKRVGICFALLCLLAPEAAFAEQVIRPAGLIRQVASSARDADLSEALCSRIEDDLSGEVHEPRSNNRAGPLLGRLLLTRDLRIPGLKHLAFRPIPTSHALGGKSYIPFVFRLKISPKRMGVDLGGHF